MTRYTIRISLLALVTAALVPHTSDAQSDVSCPLTSAPVVYAGGTLDSEIEESNGVEYFDGGSGGLRLRRAGGSFQAATNLGYDLSIFAAAADFDGDGWDDYVGGDSFGATVIYVNESWYGTPDWDDPTFSLDVEFLPTTGLGADANSYMVLAAGDFDGDGRPDVFRANSTEMGFPQSAEIWLNTTTPGSTPPTFAPSYNALAPGTLPATLGRTTWGGTNVVVVDYNGDRRLDLLIGSGDTDGGTIRIFLNSCTPVDSPPPPPALIPCVDDPTFTYAGPLIENMQLGGNGLGQLPVFAYEDFDGDGLRDLIAGSPLCCTEPEKRLQMWRGVSGGGIEPTPSQSIPFVGAATIVLAADFSLDGKPDLVVATEGTKYGSGSNIGGQAFYYENNGSSEPFAWGYKTQLAHHGSPNTDFDVGLVFNYDNDPDKTPDILLTDGNNANNRLVFGNRTIDLFVECGSVASGAVDLGPLSDSELVITSARMSPNVQLNGGTINWFMSNEDPPNWVAANDCGDGTGDLCATFPRAAGRDIRWMAVMCANFDATQSPVILGIDLRYDYTEASQHLRAGVVMSDGVAYVGAFSQPGDRGKLYAIAASLGVTYWEFGQKLDAMLDTDRRIYTSRTDGDGVRRAEFRWTGNSANDDDVLATLDASDEIQAQAVIDWVRSARFGVGNVGLEPTKLGGVEMSTPAVVNKPGLPLWYTLAGTNDRRAVTSFIDDYATRIPIILFGSKDGMIHAVRNDPTDINNTENGKEAWAFIPERIASRMLSDYMTSLGGELSIAAYPDGAPTVADVRIDGALRTVAVVGSGSGGKSITAMDITQTIDPSTNVVTGPEPLWHQTPGGADAGQSYAKPVIARVAINEAERFIVIAGTGISFDNVTPPYTRGRTVAAYDMATGTPLWKFQTACPLSSHIAVFESDDPDEYGTPKVDGFMDRVVFADRCGYVYKLDPAVDLSGAWYSNSKPAGKDETMMKVGEIDDHAFYALFSTKEPGALEAERPIGGTLGARVDTSGRVVLYFGTGGLEDFDPTLQNEFYAVYADDGTIRSKLTGACNTVTSQCEKYYGGVVVTSEQVIYTRSTDRRIGTGICDNGETVLGVVRINADDDNEFVGEFEVDVSGAAMGGLYGDAGAVYLTTLSGNIVRVGTPRAAEAGGDTSSGNTGGHAEGEVGTFDSLILMGWRQIF